ncbi:unnamed protein product [Durusdinium trenchii]|uniref:Uncharacterized protein n=1 Tax=Durusdinium trenchii TaxID=1381693 RepID=A0ABP0KB65_9DINO
MAPSRGPCTVEWRAARRAARVAAPAKTPRVALCLLGVPRFFDATAQLFRLNFLDRIEEPWDLFAFATASRRPTKATCPRFHRFLELEDGDKESLPSALLAAAPSKAARLNVGHGRSTPLVAWPEWQELQVFLKSSVAGIVAWGDQPLELMSQHPTAAWRRAAGRPGAWLGGLAASGVGHDDVTGGKDRNWSNMSSFSGWGVHFSNGTTGHHVRPGAGLAQLRALQWCADAVKWHETNVMGHQYSHILYARWDLQWLIPLPKLTLLSEMDEDAIWLPAVQGQFFTNDRFAVVPRQWLSAYFEGWKLVISGEAENVFESQMSRVGRPNFLSDSTDCEAFLYARLSYMGARAAELPPIFYVQCEPSKDLDTRNLRSLGHFSCTPFSALMEVEVRGFDELSNREIIEALGGAKYSNELAGVMATESLLQGLPTGSDAWEAQGPTLLMHLIKPVVQHLALQEVEPVNLPAWTKQHIANTVFLAQQVEVARAMQKGLCLEVEDWRRTGYMCSRLLEMIMTLAMQRHELFWDAVRVARAAVWAAPLFLEHWIRLGIVLSHPSLDMSKAAGALVRQALVLNPHHNCLLGMAKVLEIPPRSMPGGEDEQRRRLEAALGGSNASRRTLSNSGQAILLSLRMRDQQRRVREQAVTGATTGAQWLQYARLLTRRGWLIAALGVCMHLEASLLSDARPEALRELSTQVLDETRRCREPLTAALLTKTASHWGADLDAYEQHVPTPNELLSERWLTQQEVSGCSKQCYRRLSLSAPSPHAIPPSTMKMSRRVFGCGLN